MLIKLRYNATALTKILNEPKEQQVLMYLCNKKISKVLMKRFYGNIPLLAKKLYTFKRQRTEFCWFVSLQQQECHLSEIKPFIEEQLRLHKIWKLCYFSICSSSKTSLI